MVPILIRAPGIGIFMPLNCHQFGVRDSRIAQLAASPGYHYTMVLDSDTVCPAKSIRKLLETAEHSANQLLSSTSSSKNCFESVGILLKVGVF